MKYQQRIEIIDEQLLRAKNSLLMVDIVIISKKCCPECEKLHNVNISLLQALKHRPIPYKGCKNERGCTCKIALIPLRDKDGTLIRNDYFNKNNI